MVTTTWSQTAGMTSETGTDNIEDYAEQAEASKNAAAASETAAASSASAASTSASSASTDAASALSSKNAAATSETNAATSEANAASSSVTASTAATNASTSASNSASSATASANSASAAATSETNAATSETNAAASETAAAGSATSASTSETNAATSETNATASETAAATSETNAATSETNAATSETNAATSETNAATSETNAASSATAAASSASAASTSATSASNAQTAAESARDATLTAYDNFDDRYLGAKSSAPTVDNDGNALVAGSLYFDTVSGAMRVYTGSAWVAAYVNGADYLALSGGTMTGDVAHGDGVKATFGAGQDLQIYHDGSNSYISDADAGNLSILSNGAKIALAKLAPYEFMVEAITDGAVNLYYDGSKKLATTTSGIDVTGTVSADDSFFLTGASDTLIRVTAASGSNSELKLLEAGAGDVGANIQYDGAANQLKFKVANDLDRTRMSISRDLGDISFYEDTGTNAKLTWDASDEALEFGDNVKATFGASADLEIYHDGSNSFIRDLGAGNLTIDTNGSTVDIKGSSPTEYMARFIKDGAVELYHNNSKKLETTTSGIDVSGTVVADGLTVDGAIYVNGSGVNLDDAYSLSWGDGSAQVRGSGSSEVVELRTSSLTRLQANAGGDISFYEDTGSQAKLTWDASDPALEFGDSVKATFGASADLAIFHDGSNSYIQEFGTGNLILGAGNAFEVRSSDNVTTGAVFNAYGSVDLNYNGSTKLSTTSTGVDITGTLGATTVDFGNWTITESGGSLYFATGGTNKMKLDASGNLDVVGSVNSNATIT